MVYINHLSDFGDGLLLGWSHYPPSFRDNRCRPVAFVDAFYDGVTTCGNHWIENWRWSQTSDNMDTRKSRGGKSQRGEEQKREDQRRARVRRKKMQVREKVGKLRNIVFPMICGSGGSKSRLAKAAGAEPCGQMRDEKLHAAVVARSTCPSQNVQSTPFSDHFWKFRCRKSARSCGAKHISKSKCTNHPSIGPLLEVVMSKKCAPLWCEARFQFKSAKNWGVPSTFGGILHIAKKWAKCEGFLAVSTTTTTTPHYTPRHYNYNYNYNHNCNYITLRYTNYITQRYTTLHSTTLHDTNHNYNTLH